VNVDDDGRRRLARLALEAQPDPPATVLVLVTTARRYGVGEGEEGGGLAAGRIERLDHLVELVVEHCLEWGGPFATPRRAARPSAPGVEERNGAAAVLGNRVSFCRHMGSEASRAGRADAFRRRYWA
jgi:hypothetical protein